MPVDTANLKQRIDLLELIGCDTRLKRVASTPCGEYAGPAVCGGRDRLRVQPAQRTEVGRCRIATLTAAAALQSGVVPSPSAHREVGWR